MQAEIIPDTVAGAVQLLNRDSLERSALNLLDDLLVEKSIGEVALVSSFGAESAVLLHLVARVNPDTPVLMLDTGFLFPETIAYQQELVTAFGLGDFRRLTPDPADLASLDPDNRLHKDDVDGCCNVRKTLPLNRALAGFSGWITGRKRFQSGTRSNIQVFEADPQNLMIKINPLAHWESYDLKAYFEKHDLPRHPLVAKGYPSIGCAPCTSRVGQGEDPRSGRWKGREKDECGIHMESGKPVRQDR